jgi:hypothetical protein
MYSIQKHICKLSHILSYMHLWELIPISTGSEVKNLCNHMIY